jgi:LPS export ABC transporter protein LptC
MMSGALRNSFLFVLLSLAAAGTWLLSRPPQATTGPPQDERPAPLGYYLRNAVIMGTDADGAVAYRIFAARVEQAAERDDLVLTDVRVEYDAREDIAWLVTAARAAARDGGAELDLYGGVRLATRPDKSADAIVIETQQLLFAPETYLAIATMPVSVTRGSGELRSSSMSADLKSDRIDLEEVHGQFDR